MLDRLREAGCRSTVQCCGASAPSAATNSAYSAFVTRARSIRNGGSSTTCCGPLVVVGPRIVRAERERAARRRGRRRSPRPRAGRAAAGPAARRARASGPSSRRAGARAAPPSRRGSRVRASSGSRSRTAFAHVSDVGARLLRRQDRQRAPLGSVVRERVVQVVVARPRPRRGRCRSGAARAPRSSRCGRDPRRAATGAARPGASAARRRAARAAPRFACARARERPRAQ